MKIPALFTSFPLLARELTELAAKRRTWITRSILAGIICLIFFIMFISQAAGRHITEVYGVGSGMFSFLVWVEGIEIVVYLPAAMAGAITQEKENNTLQLLLITGLRPWEIAIQKYASRVIPLLNLLLIALPLLTLAYALGGVSAQVIFGSGAFLFVMILFFGAISLLISSVSAKSVTAIVISLLACIAVAILSPIYVLLLERMFQINPSYVYLYYLIPALAFSFVFLWLASRYLRPEKNPLENSPMQGILHGLNKSLFGSKVKRDMLVSGQLDKSPVYWLESNRGLFARTSFLVVVIVLLEAVVFVLVSRAAGSYIFFSLGSFWIAIPYCIWFLVSFVSLAGIGTNLPSRDRSNGVLGLLLTTPLEAKDYVKQKVLAFYRISPIFWLPLCTLISGYLFAHGNMDNTVLYYIFSISGIFIYLLLTLWFSILIGMIIRSRAKAILVVLLAMFLWIIVPFILVMSIVTVGRGDEGGFFITSIIGPSANIIFAAGGLGEALSEGVIVFGFIINLIAHGILLVVLRKYVLVKADKYLTGGL